MNLKNSGLAQLFYDPYSAILASKLQYQAMEHLIENEENKREAIAFSNDDLKKYMQY